MCLPPHLKVYIQCTCKNPKIYSAGHSYKNQILELMNLLHRNMFSPWEDFFVNPFGSDVISPNQLYVSVHVSVQVLVEAHAVEQ